MKVVPVLDVMDSRVVRGIAGKRETYAPIVSKLTADNRPVAVAQAISETYGLYDFYLADLDAITGKNPPDLRLYHELLRNGFSITVDAGLRDAEQARAILDIVAFHYEKIQIVAGLETLQSPNELRRLIDLTGPDHLLVSIDLFDGAALSSDYWPKSVDALVSLLIDIGVSKLLFLDLARVGTATGIGTEEQLRRTVADYPNCHVFAGGGVRHFEDLCRARDLGLAGILVASILHDHKVTNEQIRLL